MISSTSFSSSPSIWIGGGAFLICEGNWLSWYGSRREMWNLFYMAMEGGKASLYALVPIFAKIIKGPIFL